MSSSLSGKRIAFLMANSGVEEVELTRPWHAVQEADGRPTLLAPQPGQVQAFHNDVEPAQRFDVDARVADADPDSFAALVLPGGTTNPDQLRLDHDAIDFVRRFVETRRPVAAVCHGPWSLVEADVLRGKTLTSWPSLRTDIRNAGGTWIDEQVFVCPAEGWVLVTSRKPDDLYPFSQSLVEQAALTESAAGATDTE